jgi:hypothetical protein
MAYVGESTVEITAWVSVGAHSKITYQVYPAQDLVELTLGGRDGLEMQTCEAGLRNCIAAFTGALEAFETATAAAPDATRDN